jgi:hypothetical protein
VGVGAITTVYATLYALNYWLPLQGTNYTTRIWDWSQAALTVGAAVVIAWYRAGLTRRSVLSGLALGLLSGLSHYWNDPSVWWNLWQGISTWACYLGGVLLFQGHPAPRVAAFEAAPAEVGHSLVLGIALVVRQGSFE